MAQAQNQQSAAFFDGAFAKGWLFAFKTSYGGPRALLLLLFLGAFLTGGGTLPGVLLITAISPYFVSKGLAMYQSTVLPPGLQWLRGLFVLFEFLRPFFVYGAIGIVTLMAGDELLGSGNQLIFLVIGAACFLAAKVTKYGTSYADGVAKVLLLVTVVGFGLASANGDGLEAILPVLLVVGGLGFLTNHIMTPRLGGTISREGYRGKGLIHVDAAREILKKRFGTYEPTLSWGGLPLPDEAVTVHFYITGSPGSGKSLSLRLLITQVLLSMQERQNQRAVIYDPKQELLPLLGTFGATMPVVVFNPLDARSTPWNLAHDFTDDASADQLAAMLIPEPTSGDRYWAHASRAILAGVIKALNHTAPLRWRLRDVLTIIRSPVLLSNYLKARPDLAHIAELHFANEKTAHSLLSQLHSDLAPYEIVAALWDHLERQGVDTTAVKYFLDAPKGVIVFSNDPRYTASISPFYRLFISRLSDTIRSPKPTEYTIGSSTSESRTWLILDELASMGKLPGLMELLAEGRSFGACVALGFQDIHHLYSLYGKDETNAILGQIGNRAVLRIENAVTAEAMSQQFSKREVIQTSRTRNADGGESVSSSFGEEQLVLGKQIQDLKRPIPEPLFAYYSSTFTGPYVGGVTAEQLLASGAAENKQVPRFIPHQSPDAQRLRPWDEEDMKRLGVIITKTEEPSRRRTENYDDDEDEAPKTHAGRRRPLFSVIK